MCVRLRGARYAVLSLLCLGGLAACRHPLDRGGKPTPERDEGRASLGSDPQTNEAGTDGETAALASLDTVETRARRKRLVDAITRAKDVRNARVIQALLSVPRHAFVPAWLQDSAYRDKPLPIGHGQTISQPTVVAMMTEALRLTGQERVLEIGTGSGYQAAVLAELAREVWTIERIPELGASAEQQLRRLGYRNVRVRVGDGYAGWPEGKPFDRIIVTAAPPSVPQVLLDQLAENGLLVAPLGPEHGVQTLWRYHKSANGVRREALGEVRFVPMVPGPGRNGSD